MKATLKKYPYYFSEYQLYKLLCECGVSDERADQISEYIFDNTPIQKISQWFYDWQEKRRVKIKLDPWDSWNAGNTIVTLALPVMKQLMDRRGFNFYVHDEDVPDHLKSCYAPRVEHEYDWDDNNEKRCEWVANEIIFALEHFDKEDDILDYDPNKEEFTNYPEYDNLVKRVNNGLTLFGKYMRAFWD